MVHATWIDVARTYTGIGGLEGASRNEKAAVHHLSLSITRFDMGASKAGYTLVVARTRCGHSCSNQASQTHPVHIQRQTHLTFHRSELICPIHGHP